MARKVVPRVRVLAEGSQKILAIAELADTAAARMVGLLGRSALNTGEGLVLHPCRLIHTCFMRFSIDLIFLNGHGRVLKVVDALRPFRWAWGGLTARAAIELPAGTLRCAGVTAGEHIRLERP